MFLRISENEKILISKFPLLCYVIYYISCTLTNNYIWLWNVEKDKSKGYLIQNVIIHSLVDLINSIFEANFSKDKKFLYEKINAKLKNKIMTVYDDIDL